MHVRDNNKTISKKITILFNGLISVSFGSHGDATGDA
jgi:hypothetical protein